MISFFVSLVISPSALAKFRPGNNGNERYNGDQDSYDHKKTDAAPDEAATSSAETQDARRNTA